MKRITLIALIASVSILAGCGQWGRGVAQFTGYSESCIDGVQYIQFASGATVKYNKDGTVVTC